LTSINTVFPSVSLARAKKKGLATSGRRWGQPLAGSGVSLPGLHRGLLLNLLTWSLLLKITGLLSEGRSSQKQRQRK
jgi:hypothetical protein